MADLIRPIRSLLGGVALLLLGAGLLNTLIPVRGHRLGFPDGFLGALTSAYFGGYLLGTFLAPPMIRRVGYIRAFALCAAVCTSVALLHALSADRWLWLALRVLIGAAFVVLYTIIESWLNSRTEAAHRGKVFAVYMIVNLCSLAVAQQLLRSAAGRAFVPFALVALLVCLSMLPVLWTRQPQPDVQPVPRLGLRRLFDSAPSAGAGAVLAGLSMGSFWGLLPVYAVDHGLPGKSVATLMSITIIGGAALQWPLGWLSDRHDRRLALALVGAAAGVLAIAAASTTTAGAANLAIMFLYGGAVFAVYPIIVAHLLDYLPPDEVLAASSSVLFLFGIGSAIGPLLAGMAMSALGPWSLFAWFALIHAVLAVFAGYRYRAFTREATVASNFSPMVRTTPASLEMHPGVDTTPDSK